MHWNFCWKNYTGHHALSSHSLHTNYEPKYNFTLFWRLSALPLRRSSYIPITALLFIHHCIDTVSFRLTLTAREQRTPDLWGTKIKALQTPIFKTTSFCCNVTQNKLSESIQCVFGRKDLLLRKRLKETKVLHALFKLIVYMHYACLDDLCPVVYKRKS